MADDLSYHSYLPPYYQQQPLSGSPATHRPEVQKKRPKYTRSKTGCLTCRVKKIKCDETKPNCMRCTHGQRECTWPEVVPPRKKSKKDSIDDERPSTSSSSSPTPPLRGQSPPDNGRTLYAPRASTDLNQLGAGSLLTRPLSGVPASTYSTANNNPPLYPPEDAYADRQPSNYASDQYASVPPMTRYAPSSRPAASHDVSSRSLSHVGYYGSPATASLDPLQGYFPSTQERNLIRYYCNRSVSFIIAAPSELNPVVAANLPLILNRPPGDFAGEALRMALLGVAAIHQSFLLAGSEATIYGARQMLEMADSFRVNAKQMLAKACTTVQGARSDASLAASVAIALMDIFSGGRNWLKNMHLAKTLVNVRGGSMKILSESEDGMKTRVLLEILAVYDIFGSLALGDVPSLLVSAEEWWDSHPNPNASSSFVEQMFGMSRPFILLLAKVTIFLGHTFKRDGSQIVELDASSSSSPDGSESYQDAARQALECQQLYIQLENWLPPQQVNPRVQMGDDIYRQACQILLLRDAMKEPYNDERVQGFAKNILDLILQCCRDRMAVDLIWPTIIAASQLDSCAQTARSEVLEIFEGFKAQCCYETETSRNIVLQVWDRLDNNVVGADWRTVTRDLNLNVLIV